MKQGSRGQERHGIADRAGVRGHLRAVRKSMEDGKEADDAAYRHQRGPEARGNERAEYTIP